MQSSKKPSPPCPSISVLQPCRVEILQWDMQEIQLAIARRAYELFESRNREHGHEWEDWFQAESELLRPVSIAVSESADRFSICANVLGFTPDEIKFSIEPTRIAILGRKRMMTAPATSQVSPDVYPDLIMKTIDIPTEVDPVGAVVEMNSAILMFDLPKVMKPGTPIRMAA